jgi:hypothetical protein
MKGILALEDLADLPADGFDMAEIKLSAAQAGCPPQRKEISVCMMPVADPWWHAGWKRHGRLATTSCMPGSTIELWPAASCSTLEVLRSTPMTEIALGARQGGCNRSDYPSPNTLTSPLMSSDCGLLGV